MIIIRADETQTLPGAKHRVQSQYYGQGTEYSRAGGQIAGTANQAVTQAAHLADVQAHEEAKNTMLQESAHWKNDLDTFINDQVTGWDRQYVQNGKAPEDSLKAFDEGLKSIRQGFIDNTQINHGNKYLDDAFESTWAHFAGEARIRAREQANKGFIGAQRGIFERAIDAHKIAALREEAVNGHEAYASALGTINAAIDSGAQTIMAPPEREAFKKATLQDLESKRAFQTVARNPEQFISDYHLNQFPDLDPKLAKDLLSSAEVSLGRKVEMDEKARNDRTLQLVQARTDLRNELLTQAYKGDISGAMTEALKPTNRIVLDTEYDSTLATLRTMAREGVAHDNPSVVAALKREIDHNPSEATYKGVEKAFQNGDLKQETFAGMTTRITERREHFKDQAFTRRKQAIDDSVSTFKPLLDTVSKMSFDKLGADAVSMWEDELKTRLEANPSLNPMDEGRRLVLKYRQLIEDRNEAAGGALVTQYGFKTVDEVVQAYKQKRISQLESDVLIHHLKNGATAKPSTPTDSQPSTLLKKK